MAPWEFLGSSQRKVVLGIYLAWAEKDVIMWFTLLLYMAKLLLAAQYRDGPRNRTTHGRKHSTKSCYRRPVLGMGHVRVIVTKGLEAESGLCKMLPKSNVYNLVLLNTWSKQKFLPTEYNHNCSICFWYNLFQVESIEITVYLKTKSKSSKYSTYDPMMDNNNNKRKRNMFLLSGWNKGWVICLF